MIAAGIDIGSRTIGIALIDTESRQLVDAEIIDSGYDPIARARRLVESRDFDFLVATGYGRHPARARFADAVITEIKAYAVGASHLYPEAKGVLDIGGQDTKAILLDDNGRVKDFQMNEKCAAGTGKFLEVMALALGYELDEFGRAAMSAGGNSIKISSMCTVFAESEVVSLLHEGESRENVAKAVHDAIAERAAGLLKRIRATSPVLFAGGVAQNPYLKAAIEKRTGLELVVPEQPQLVGALGAACEAARKMNESVTA